MHKQNNEMMKALIDQLLKIEEKTNPDNLFMVIVEPGQKPKMFADPLCGQDFEENEFGQAFQKICTDTKTLMVRPKDAIYNRNPSEFWNLVDPSFCQRGSCLLVFRNFEIANNAVALIEMQLEAKNDFEQKKYARDIKTFILPSSVATFRDY